MRSIISSICRVECLAGADHNQLCTLDPDSCGCVSVARHRSKPALVDNDEPMIVEPAPHKAEKALRIVGAREFLAHHAHEAASMMLAEPAKAQRLTSQLLMFDQGRSAAIHRTQRGQVRSGDVEARAQMLPQQ